MKRIFFGCCVWLLMAGTVHAQVATPSLDPARPSEIAAANSWRFHSTLAVENPWHKNQPSYLFNQLANQGVYANAAWMFGNFMMEWTARPGEAQDFYHQGVIRPQTNDSNRIKLSVRGNGEVSVGVTSISEDLADTDGTLSKSRTRSGYGGSFGVRWGTLFGGFGLDVMKERVPGEPEEKHWQVLKAGIGYLTGDPAKSQFRVEYSMLQTSGVAGTTYWNSIAGNQETIMSMEYHYDGYYMGVTQTNQTRSALTGETANTTTTDLEYGVGLRTIDHSFIATRTDRDQAYGANANRAVTMRITYGFNFM